MPAEPSKEWVFELTGGTLCLDFANTVSDRGDRATERLRDYFDLLSWSRQASALDDASVRSLGRGAALAPRRARLVLRHAIRLRECLYRLFSALARGEEPAPADVRFLNEALVVTLARARLVPIRGGFKWAWSHEVRALDRMLWPVVRSAAELLTSSERALVRECAARPCGWLFVDRSRTHQRRWCDMRTCGNRAKVRRHYERWKARRRAGRSRSA